MKLTDLKYHFPENLIAIEPTRPTRVMWVEEGQIPIEFNLQQVIEKIPAGDILVINDTKVLKRRVFAGDLEILFLDQLENNRWSVLFPSKKFSIGDTIHLPNNFKMKLLEKGLPQQVEISDTLTEAEFEKMAELPLPPYIQKARDQRHNSQQDEKWYQTAWAEKPGSMAAPTASLHFSSENIAELKNRGVEVLNLTLHVGLGTFLPVKVEDLDQHKMHSEQYSISVDTWNLILEAKKKGKKIWSLGTTTTRVIESVARTGQLSGKTDILLQVGSEFKIVDRLMTNFHQPESTLLALVAGFSSLDVVKKSYSWAIERKFKLFSYGDFSIWLK